MPSQVNMKIDSDLYRATLEYEQDQVSFEMDPNKPHGPRRRIVTGPPVTKEQVIGPYTSTGPIKSYVTRHRGSYYQNLRIAKVEKVSSWEEVGIY